MFYNNIHQAKKFCTTSKVFKEKEIMAQLKQKVFYLFYYCDEAVVWYLRYKIIYFTFDEDDDDEVDVALATDDKGL